MLSKNHFPHNCNFPFLLWKERIFFLEFHTASFDWKHESPSFRRQFLSKPKSCRDHGHSHCSWLSPSELPFSSMLIKIFCTFILWLYKKIFQKNMVLVSIFCREQVVGNSYNCLLKIVLCNWHSIWHQGARLLNVFFLAVRRLSGNVDEYVSFNCLTHWFSFSYDRNLF